jgi:hypothetical protein
MGSADTKMKGRLLLEDGCEFEGIHFGANVTVPGEVGNIAILFIGWWHFTLLEIIF